MKKKHTKIGSLYFLGTLIILGVLKSANGGQWALVTPLVVMCVFVMMIVKAGEIPIKPRAAVITFIGCGCVVYGAGRLLLFQEYSGVSFVDAFTFYSFFILVGLFSAFADFSRCLKLKKILSILIAVLFIDGVTEFIFGYSFLRDGGRNNIRVHSIFNTQHYGSYMFLMLLLYSVLSYKINDYKYWWLIWMVCFASSLIALSRLSIVLILVHGFLQYLYFFLLNRNKKYKLFIVAPVFAICIIALGYNYYNYMLKSKYALIINNFVSIDSILEEQYKRRFSEVDVSRKIIAEHPVFGITASRYDKYSKVLKESQYESLVHPHSLLLEFILYSGIPLFVCIASIVIYYIAKNGMYGVLLLVFFFPPIGPGSTANASWMLFTAIGLAALLSDKIAYHDRRLQ